VLNQFVLAFPTVLAIFLWILADKQVICQYLYLMLKAAFLAHEVQALDV